MPSPKKDIIHRLQQELLQWSVHKTKEQQQGLPASLRFLEPYLPQGRFPAAAIHEFLCGAEEELAATAAFVAGLCASLFPPGGALVWISRRRTVFPPALHCFQLQPEQIIFIHPPREEQLCWAVEEALQCATLTAVIAEVTTLGFTQSRRLQLAAEKSGVMGLVLNLRPAAARNNTCMSRWQIRSVPSSTTDGLPGVGHPRWETSMLKMRNGKPGKWVVEWKDNQFHQVQTHSKEQQLPLLHQQAG